MIMDEDKPFEVWLRPSAPRRGFAIAVLYVLGGLLAYLAVVAPPVSFVWQAFLIAMALGSFVLAHKTTQSTQQGLQLTKAGLFLENGNLLCPIENVRAVARGPFAFKPSGGFGIRCHNRMPGRWAPGLYWSMGRSIGVGGVTGATEGKMMAETLSLMLESRAQGGDGGQG